MSAILALAAGLSACSADAERLRGSPEDRAACVPGTFIGSMAINCPQQR